MKNRKRTTVDSTPSEGLRPPKIDTEPRTHDFPSTAGPLSRSNPQPSSLAPSKGALGKRQRGDQHYIVCACLAGACGALSGVVGKLAVTSTNAPALADYTLKTLEFYNAYLPISGVSSTIRSERMVSVLSWLLRSVFFIANAFFTGQMWRYYLKALSAGSTPVCQILNTGTNFAVSAFIGILFFLEEVNVMWVCGALMVLAGLALIVMDPRASPSQ
ncbi:unnamed protein product [Phytomonas sp. EM1]|nr:unnamed protein product [Phytomonas sp. EM1]|eukprot:CCW60407.1 unnamed protein product [Phytomonas sp. isolate EM1]